MDATRTVKSTHNSGIDSVGKTKAGLPVFLTSAPLSSPSVPGAVVSAARFADFLAFCSLSVRLGPDDGLSEASAPLSELDRTTGATLRS